MILGGPFRPEGFSDYFSLLPFPLRSVLDNSGCHNTLSFLLNLKSEEPGPNAIHTPCRAHPHPGPVVDGFRAQRPRLSTDRFQGSCCRFPCRLFLPVPGSVAAITLAHHPAAGLGAFPFMGGAVASARSQTPAGGGPQLLHRRSQHPERKSFSKHSLPMPP